MLSPQPVRTWSIPSLYQLYIWSLFGLYLKSNFFTSYAPLQFIICTNMMQCEYCIAIALVVSSWLDIIRYSGATCSLFFLLSIIFSGLAAKWVSVW